MSSCPVSVCLPQPGPWATQLAWILLHWANPPSCPLGLLLENSWLHPTGLLPFPLSWRLPQLFITGLSNSSNQFCGKSAGICLPVALYLFSWMVAFSPGATSSSLFIFPEYLISSWSKSGLRFSGQKLGLWLTLPSVVSRTLLRPDWKPSRHTLIKLPALRSWAPLLCWRGSGPPRALPLHGLPAAEV